MIGHRVNWVVSWALVLAICPVLVAAPPSADAKQDGRGQKYLRLLRKADGTPLALEAAVVRCAPRDAAKRSRGPVVDLVSAVHVAEKGYYTKLNREFRDYDAVLYELVAPEGTRIPKGGGGSDSPVSAVQMGITNVLELEFQLNAIDYGRPNMVHADMSPEQFAASMQRRGESVLTMFMRMLGYALARQQGSGQSPDAQLLLAFFDKNRALALKRVLAEQFEDLEGSLLALDGPDGSTIISERNKVALGVLRKQLAAGKKRIAIFYGAGHMPDLHRRLRDDFGLATTRTRWLAAWNLQPKTKPAAKPQRDTAKQPVPQ